jgi:hypothetical protein
MTFEDDDEGRGRVDVASPSRDEPKPDVDVAH